MTREEKIAELINIRDNFNYTLAPREVFDDAIKALEQEQTTTVLQEIRQEIDSHGIIMQISNGEKIIGENVYIAKEIVLEIIDKHISGKEKE